MESLSVTSDLKPGSLEPAARVGRSAYAARRVAALSADALQSIETAHV
ncbi:hypothetical protein [Sphingobium sp. SCG-1]|nr:hypothetical protein [Sphingobium sp. SCG-1]